jgi:hypothetical protein
MKHRVKNRLLLVRACAEGVWQCTPRSATSDLPGPPDLLRWPHDLVPQAQAGTEAA